MSRIWTVITADTSAVAGVLAAEALKSAASARGIDIQVAVRTGQGEPDAPDLSQLASGDRLLLVDTPVPEGAEGAEITHRRLDEVLNDPGAVLDALGRLEGRGAKRIVAVTSCPTGIAHTFMAAEGLLEGARAMGHVIRVETQGSVGARDALTAEEIAEADIVLIAADREVARERFRGKRVHVSGTKQAISDAQGLISRALDQATVQAEEATAKPAASGSSPSMQAAGAYKHLMNGISFMLPFVVAGGLLIALAFAIGGIDAGDAAQSGTLAGALFEIGAKGAFSLIVPALAGYIAFSIADRPGLAPGMVGGVLAASLGAGFIGGIIAGFIAGYVTDFLSRNLRLPRTLEGLKPILILPLLGTLITGLLMVYAVGKPVAAALAFLTDWLQGLQGVNAALLGILLGAMSCFDFGGPVNKAGYAFSTGLISAGVYTPMAATMAAGMVPPLAVGLACRLFRKRFTAEEYEAGNAALVLGAAFISEGAIPFAARDPLRVIPACMAGGALAGAITMMTGTGLKVPHGGIFILPIPGAVTAPLIFLVAVGAGAVLSALILGAIKKPAAPAPAPVLPSEHHAH